MKVGDDRSLTLEVNRVLSCHGEQGLKIKMADVAVFLGRPELRQLMRELTDTYFDLLSGEKI